MYVWILYQFTTADTEFDFRMSNLKQKRVQLLGKVGIGTSD